MIEAMKYFRYEQSLT